MSGLNPPLIFPRAVDHNGVPSPGAKLYATVTETSIPKALYFDFAKTNPCPYPLVADSEGRFPQFFLEAGGYDFSVKDENGNLLRPPENHIFGASGEGGFPEPSGDTYKVKVDSDDAVPGFLQDKLADTTDMQFSLTEDGKQLDNIIFQLTGLGSRLNRIKNVGFDFEQGPFPAASNAGGRGISFGRRFVAGVEVDAWVAQGNNGKLYWTSNNDSTRWVISEEDTAVYTEYPSGRAYYGWSCIKFVYVAGTHNCFCWLMGSGDIERTIVFFEHKPENYNADGTIKASALDSVTYVGSTAGPRTVIDIMQVDTTGGIFLAGDDPRVGYTTDLSTFQLAMTAVDKNIGGFGFDGDITVQAIERDTGVIWRSTSYGVPGTFAKVPSFYLDNVLVSNFPMSQPSGTAAQWGSMFCMYGQWLSVNFSYVAGGIGFIYSDDGIYWYSSKDEATAFYDANNDGLRWFATNAVPNSGTPIFQLIVSMIPVHRRLSLEKGGVVSGPLILREFPNTPFLGTDHRGRIIPGPANKVAGRDALGISTFMGTLLDDEDAATARATIGLQRNGGREWDIYPTSRTAYSDYRYSQMAWSGAVFVQVTKGSSATLYRYSSDALTWTEASMPVLASWQGIAWCASSSLFVAVGYTGAGTGVVYTSPNGVTWTARTVPGVATYLYGVAVNGATLIACGNSGSGNARSVDGGLTWTAFGTLPYDNVFYLNGKFILVQSAPGASGTTTSADGVAWDTPVDHTDDLMMPYTAHPMTFFNGRYWCGGYNNTSSKLMTSTDGKTWVRAESISGNDLIFPSTVTAWLCFAATARGMFAVVDTSGNEALLRTTDGFLWEMVGPLDGFQLGSSSLGNIEYLAGIETLLVTGYMSSKNFSAFAYA